MLLPIAVSQQKLSEIFTKSLLLISSLQFATSFAPPHGGECRFFLDTADPSEWDELLPRGLFHGVTTNPTLLDRANEPCTVANLHFLFSKALHYTEEFMCQTWGSTAEEMYKTGMAISELDRDRIVIKVPVTAMGAEAATKLAMSGVRVCLTACYNSKQALIAASMGVEYIAPYLGRYVFSGNYFFYSQKYIIVN